MRTSGRPPAREISAFVGLDGTDMKAPFDILLPGTNRATSETLAPADQIAELTLLDPEAFGLSE